MKLKVFLFFFMACSFARADLTVSPRYDYFLGAETELANRFLVKTQLNAGKGPFSVFIDGFTEFEGNESQRTVRRSPPRGYLQEAYFELKMESFFVRVGRQALRWSESWTVPSLDVWTGRRWNRLFLDPFSEQLVHPTGVAFSYAPGNFSLDLVGVGEAAESTFPMPIHSVKPDSDTGYGIRSQWMWGGLGLSVVGAEAQKKRYYGMSGNYAFDKAVPRFEIGSSHDVSPNQNKNTEQSFSTLGCDIFLDNWILLPQVSAYEVLTADQKDIQTTFYLSLQWNPDKHNLQVQSFQNLKAKDSFFGVSYGYNVTDNFSASGFVQNYQGQQGLYKIYEDITGGMVFGFRLEVTGNLAF